jgi:hypothetical protein
MAPQPAGGLYIELRALVAKFSQDMDGAVKSVLGAEKKISGAFKTIQKIGQAALVIGGAAAVYKLGQAVGALAEKGDELDDLTASFKQLGGTSAQLDAAKTALLGTVSSMDLMKIANEGMIKQIPGLADNFGLMADYAGRFAEATGKDAKAALEELVGAMTMAKEKQLASLGIVIDADLAYEQYAASIGVTAKQLDDAQKKEARQLAALKAIEEQNGKLLPMQDSLNAAQKAMSVAMDEAQAKFGIALASNETLTEAYRKFTKVLNEINWEQLGQNAADFFATVLDWAGKVLPAVLGYINEVIGGFNTLFGSGTRAQADRMAISLAELEKELATLDERTKPYEGPAMQALFGWTPEQIEEERTRLKAAIKVGWDELNRLNGILNENTTTAQTTTTAVNETSTAVEGLGRASIPAIQNTGLAGEAIGKMGEEAKKAAAEVAKLKTEWGKYKQEADQSGLEDQINNAIQNLDQAGLDKLKDQIGTSVYNGFTEKWKEAVDKGAVSMDEISEYGQKAAKEVTDKYQAELDQAAKEHFESFAGSFDQLAGSIAGLGDALGIELDGVVNAFTTQLSEETKGKLMQGISDGLKELGIDASAGEVGAYAQVGMDVLGTSLSAGSIDKETQSNRGTGAAVGSGIGAGIGAAFGGAAGAQIGAQIGKVIGGEIGATMKWGPQNPATQARHAFANFIEEGFEKLGAVSFFDAQNRLKTVAGKNFNFLEGDTGRFNTPGWAESMNAWGEQAKGTFDALGKGFKELLGLTEDVGGQIGFLLGENLAGNIDNARLLVAQLGITFEEFDKALFESAKKGTMRWSEYRSTIAGIAEAYKPGLVAVGNLSGAMEQLVGSGGRGIAAIKSVKDTAVEAMEAGAKSIDDMGRMMIAQGVDPKVVESYLAAIKAMGITSLQQLSQASDQLAGGVVAEFENRNAEIKKQWETMTNDLKGLKDTIDKIPTEKDIQINVRTNLDDNSRQLLNSNITSGSNTGSVEGTKFASGGIVDRPTFFSYGGNKLGMAGEAGSEAIMPLTRIGGKLGVLAVQKGGGGGANYYVDARGATPGMENRIKAALREVEERAVRRSINAVADGGRRGARF